MTLARDFEVGFALAVLDTFLRIAAELVFVFKLARSDRNVSKSALEGSESSSRTIGFGCVHALDFPYRFFAAWNWAKEGRESSEEESSSTSLSVWGAGLLYRFLLDLAAWRAAKEGRESSEEESSSTSLSVWDAVFLTASLRSLGAGN
jgi:hypothetical protein